MSKYSDAMANWHGDAVERYSARRRKEDQVEAYSIIGNADDQDWLEQRKTGLGASEMAAILGESTWGSPLSIYASKVAVDAEDDLSDVEAVEWGHRLEQPILEAYRERSGRQAERSGKLLRSLEYPWALCTLDGETWIDGARWPLEIKNASEWKKDDWEQGPPRPYLIQVHHQMLVTGAAKATTACLLGGNRLVWCDVARDEQEIRRIVHAGAAFWDRVQRGDPPEPDGSEASGRALAKLYPADDGSIVELEGDFADVLDELAAAKASVKEAQGRKAELEQRVKARLGTASTGFVGRWVVSYRKQSSAGYTVEPKEYRVLRPTQRKEGRAA